MTMLLALLQGCGGGEGPGGAEDLAAGELVYRRNCFSCHASGAAGAPRLGDSRAWTARTAQGWDSLMRHTVEGIGSMPARGLCRQCTEEELALSLGYLLQRSGGLPDDVPPALLAQLEPRAAQPDAAQPDAVQPNAAQPGAAAGPGRERGEADAAVNGAGTGASGAAQTR